LIFYITNLIVDCGDKQNRRRCDVYTGKGQFGIFPRIGKKVGISAGGDYFKGIEIDLEE